MTDAVTGWPPLTLWARPRCPGEPVAAVNARFAQLRDL
jgi:hypothetical protein